MADMKDKPSTGKDAILEQEAANAAIYAVNAHDEQRSLEKVAENESHLTTGDANSEISPVHGDARDAAQGEPASDIERYEDAMNDKSHVDGRYIDPQVARSGPEPETADEAKSGVSQESEAELPSGAKEELGGVIGALGSITGLQAPAAKGKAADSTDDILSPNDHKLFGAGGDFARQKKATQEAPPMGWDPAKEKNDKS